MLVVALGVCLIFATVHAPFTRRAVQRAVVERLAGSGADLAVARLDYNLLTLRVTATGVSLAAHGRPASEAYFRADRIEVRFRPSSLLGHLRFASVELVRPSFEARRDTDGRFNLPSGGRSSGPLPAIEIGRLIVDRLDAGLLDAHGLSFIVSQASIDMRPDGVRIRGRLVAGRPGWLRTPGGEQVPLLLDGEIGYHEGRLFVRPLNLRLGTSTLAAEGTIALGPTPATANLALRAEVRLEDAARVWPALAPAVGQVRASGRLDGPLSRPSLTFDATSAAAAVRGLGVEAVSTHGTVDGAGITLEPVTFDLAHGRLSGRVRIDATGSARVDRGDDHGRPVHVEARWHDLQLSGLLAALGAHAPAGLSLTSLSGSGTARWDARGVESLSVNGATHVVARSRRHGAQTEADLALHVGGRRWSLRLDQSGGGSTRLDARLDGEIDAAAFGKTTMAGRIDVGAGLDDVRAFAELDAEATAALRRVYGQAAARIDVAGTVLSPRGHLRLAVPDLRVDGFGAGRLEAAIRLDTARAAIDRLTVALGRNVLQAEGVVPFGRAPMDVRLSATFDEVAAFLPPAASGWIPIGRVRVAARASGPVASPAIAGSVSADDLSWNGLRTGPIEGVLLVAHRRVSATLGVPGLRTVLAASFGLSAPRRYELSGRFEGSDLGRLSDLAARLGAPHVKLTGSVRAEVRVTGAADGSTAPSVETQVRSLDGELDGVPLRLVAATRVALSPTSLDIDPVRLELGGATIDAAGSLGASGDSLRISADVAVDRWLPWLQSATGFDDLRASGRVRAEMTASGPWRRPAVAGALALSAGSATAAAFGRVSDVGIRLVVEHGSIRLVEARGALSAAPIEVSGSMPLRMLAAWLPAALTASSPAAAREEDAESGLRLRASIASLDWAALSPWLPTEWRDRVEGRVAAEVDIQAPALTIESLRGTATASISEFAVGGVPIAAAAPAHLRFDAGRLVLEPASFQNRGETLSVGGSVDFNPPHPTLDVVVTGGADLGIARTFVPVAVSGAASVDLRASGEASRPRVTGTVSVVDAGIGLSNPRIAVSSLSGRLSLDGHAATLHAAGSANGGDLRIDGTLALDEAARLAGSVRLQAKDSALEFPEGLRSSVDLDVTYRLDGAGGVIAGRVVAEPGAYRRAAVPHFGSPATPGSPSPAGPSAFGATGLDVTLVTRSPALVDNPFAEIEVDADLRLTGTVDHPALSGRLVAHEGGKVSFRGNNFVLDRGMLLFDPKPGARPAVQMTARAKRSGYNIGLALSGPLDNLRVDLSSDPPLAQPDLMSLVASGSVSNSMSSSTPLGGSNSQDALVAGISSDILGLAGSSVGLDSVRVGQLDLDLMGQDVDPETRLTIGKSIGPRVNVLLSQNLRDSGLTWMITVRPAGKFDISYVSRDSASTSVELRHEMVFGGASPAAPAAAPTAARQKRAVQTVAGVTVSGAGASPTLLGATSLHAGDRFDFFQWQRDRERIEQALHEAGYLEAQVAARRSVRDESPGLVSLDFAVARGPRTVLEARGFAVDEATLRGMRAAWSLSIDEARLLADLHQRARVAMIDEGYMTAAIRVERRRDDRPGEKTIAVSIVPGPRVGRRELAFQGNQAIARRALDDEIRRLGLDRAAWHDPSALGPALTAFYHARGFVAARVTPAPFVVDGDTARLPVTIVEGVQHRVASVRVTGSAAVRSEQVLEWAAIRAGDAFDPQLLEAAARRIEKGLELEGYLDGKAALTPRADAHTGRVDIVVDLSAGARSVIAGVEVLGRGTTRESIVGRAMRLPPGTPASPATIDAAQRRLYETDAFRSVKIEVEDPAPGSGASPGSAAPPADQRVRATVTLEEAPLYRLRYGVQFGSELDEVTEQWTRNPGFAAEARRRNVFGTAFGAAVGMRVDTHKQSLRGAINIPASVFWPAISTLFVTRTRTVIESETRQIQTETQLTYQDRWRLGRGVEWTYGYSLTGSEMRTDAPQAREDTAPVNGYRSALYTAIVRDARDSPFNATRGTFHSLSVEHGDPVLGSDVGYMRYLFQGSYYLKTGPIVLAGATRFGALTHLTGDNQQTYDIRFRTGGDGEVRGYAEQSLHPPEIPGEPIGGQALLLLNGEVRFPIAGWLKGATFVDAGNAFTDLGAVSLHGLKVGVGLGFRLDTPYALFRVDFGIPVPRQPGASLGRWYFSVGQAF